MRRSTLRKHGSWKSAPLLLLIGSSMLAGSIWPVSAAEPVDFTQQIAPLLAQRCLRCHQPGNDKGGVSLATPQDLLDGGYIIPGTPADSHLLDLLIPSPESPRPAMPKEGEPLSESQVALLRSWIAEGANWPQGLVIRESSKADAAWWSLQPLADVEPPETEGMPESWNSNPIDRFVFYALRQKGLEPAPPADRRALIRRITFDLIGLPPTPGEVEAFVEDDSPDAYEKLVRRLLASPHYGEHWGRHWLDVVRFGESNGFERNVLIETLWPFRDYVIRSFNDDKPFDRLVLEHLAGNVLKPGNPDVEIGTAFLVCGPYDNVGNQDAVQAAIIRANTVDEMIRATGEAFLGLTIGCARCHDHKFDPLLQEDYYALYATFAGVYHGERVLASEEAQRQREARLQPLLAERDRLSQEKNGLETAVLQRAEAKAQEWEARWSRPPVDRYGTEDTFSPQEARFVRLVVEGRDDDPHARNGYHLDEFEAWTSEAAPRNVALASEGARASGASRIAPDFADAYDVKHVNDGRFGAHWIAAGSELTVEFARSERIGRVVFSSDRPRSLGPTHSKTTFVGEYRLLVSLDGQQWSEVANSFDRRPPTPKHRQKRLFDAEITPEERQRLAALEAGLARANSALAAVPELPRWWAGEFRDSPGPHHVFLGGDPQRKGKQVAAASPLVFSSKAPGFRLSHGDAERERRLALARWIVAPENPLTARVLANRLWHYHFGTGLVDTPSDFGYMGGRPTHPELLDWLARQVHEHGWRLKPLHELIVTSQAYRQSAAYREEAARADAASRLLWRFPPRRLTGEEVRDAMLAVAGQLDTRMGGPGFRLYRYLQDNVATYVPLDEHPPETYRRAVYHQNARAAPVDLLADFDCPDPAFAAPRRASTTTPLQALTTLNHDFTFDMARFLSERLQREADDNPARIHRAFLLCFARPPDDAELAAALRLVEQHGLAAFCRAMLNTNEFIFLR